LKEAAVQGRGRLAGRHEELSAFIKIPIYRRNFRLVSGLRPGGVPAEAVDFTPKQLLSCIGD
jgi:hypothetical protein